MEQRAIYHVMELELRAGRLPVDTRTEMDAPTDIRSADRLIAVKAAAGSLRGDDIWLEASQYDVAIRDPHFFLYLVENVAAADPAAYTVRVIG